MNSIPEAISADAIERAEDEALDELFNNLHPDQQRRVLVEGLKKRS